MRRPSTVRMGPISVFALVIILCLAVLGVLSATSASAGSAMAQRQADYTADGYRNEIAGQRFYALADDVLAPVRAQGGDAQAAADTLAAALDGIERAALDDAGEDALADRADGADESDAARASDGGLSLDAAVDGTEIAVHIKARSGRCLDVTLAVQPDATLSVTSWKATTLWAEDATDRLWTGPSTGVEAGAAAGAKAAAAG